MKGSPLLTLNNGVEMPPLGLGVVQSPTEQTASAVQAAIATGYRLIDTAAAYFNEREVGEGIRRSGIDRSELFIETKVWISDYGFDATLHAFEKSVGKLGVDQLDLLLLHQPLPSAFDRTLEAYRALEVLLADGRSARSGSATSCRSIWSACWGSVQSYRRSTRSKSTRTSSRLRCSVWMRSMGS